ncbi:hypothetical protein NUSPORA_00697 [Nucleospora cyclopteri]
MDKFNEAIHSYSKDANMPMLLSIILKSSTLAETFYVEPIIYYSKIKGYYE